MLNKRKETMLEFRTDASGNLICVFSGRLDAEAVSSFDETLLDEVQKASGHAIFYFKKVTYISSAFLRTCIKTARAIKGRPKIINVSEDCIKVFKLTGLDKIFDLSIEQ